MYICRESIYICIYVGGDTVHGAAGAVGSEFY